MQRLARSLEDAASGRRRTRSQEQTLVRLARKLGGVAVPLCSRALVSGGRAEADWAGTLLVGVARSPAQRGRVVELLLDLARRAPEDAKLRAMSLLSELDAPLPDMTELGDLGALQERSLHELIEGLTSAADVARAADHLVAQLEGHELIELADALIASTGERARALVDELVDRDDLSERIRGELARILAPLGDAACSASDPLIPSAASPEGERNGGTARPLPLFGERPEGGWVVVAREPRANLRPLRWRTLWLTVDAGGLVSGADYADELTGRAVERLLAHIDGEGAPLQPMTAERAGARVAEAARATLAAGRHLPRGYYLGRDLLGLRDEHAAGRAPAGDHSAVLLSRAVDLCADGEAERARPLLAKYVASCPDDPEGASDLGLCLLALGDAEGARAHLARAVALEPENPLHHWNLAAACHKAGRLGGCFLGLRGFLARAGRASDDDNRRIAESFVAEYERFARLDFPGVAALSLARAEGHLIDARAHQAAGDNDAAITAWQRAVRLVPAHHEAWTELGLALADTRPVRARRCIERALAARPDYEPARVAEGRLEASGTRLQARRAKRRSQPRASGVRPGA